YAEVDDLVVVAAEDDADNVLADVVDIALDRREQHLAANRQIAGFRLLGFHERQKIRDSFLHHPGAFHDLRQKHFSRAEEIADDVHPGHQRTFDDRQRARIILARFFEVFVEVIDNSFYESVREPSIHVS